MVKPFWLVLKVCYWINNIAIDILKIMTADRILIKIILFGKFAYSRVVRRETSNLKRSYFANLTSFFISSDPGLSANFLKFKKNISTDNRNRNYNIFFLLYSNCYVWRTTISQPTSTFGSPLTGQSKCIVQGLK